LNINFKVIASFAFTCVELIELLNVKLPTPPINETGLPAGRGITSTEAAFELTDRLTPCGTLIGPNGPLTSWYVST